MAKKFTGTGVAIVTPFTKKKSVDYTGLEKLVEHLISGGVEYLVVLGTTGESVTLSKEEKTNILDVVIRKTGKRVPIVLGLGGNNTAEVVNSFGHFNLKNVDAVLSVSPYYNKPAQEGIYQHYRAIASESPLPVILYNVPGRTGSNISADTTLRLASDFGNIVGVKEASGDMNQVMKIIKNKPKGFQVIAGDDALTMAIIACGGEGVISVVANAFPGAFSDMVRASLRNDFIAARKNHYKLLSVTEMFFAEGNPCGVKAALKVLGVCEDNVRLPLVNISPALFEKIKAETKKI